METIPTIITEKNIYPSKGFLLLDVPDKPTQTVTGVLVADSNAESVPMMAEIIRVGKPWWKFWGYKTGQTVLFRRYSVDELKIKDGEGEKKFYLLEEENVLSLIK